MRIGYGRVSTRDQNPGAERDALTAAGCDQVFIGKASGKLARRPELDRALPVTRAGDQLVVIKLDRVLGHGMIQVTGSRPSEIASLPAWRDTQQPPR
jgi:DNA invertase Pin-like site-specific DNA recombinase